MKIKKEHRKRILKSIVKHYMINSKDGAIKYISRYENLINEWKTSDIGFYPFCLQIKGRGKAWNDAVNWVLEESKWWD